MAFDKEKTTLVQYPIGSAVTSYTVPSGTKTIAGNAFYYAKSLQSVVFPDSVTAIGDSAFAVCTA